MNWKMSLCVVFGVAAFSGSAVADTMESSFTNTVTVSSGALTVRYHFNPDGSYRMSGPDESTSVGTWLVRGDQICLTPENGAQACAPYAPDKQVGDTWEAPGPDGQLATISITPGR